MFFFYFEEIDQIESLTREMFKLVYNKKQIGILFYGDTLP